MSETPMAEPPPDEPTAPEPESVPVLLPADDGPDAGPPPVVLRPAGPSSRTIIAVLASGAGVVAAIGLGFAFFPVDTLSFLLSAAIIPPLVTLPLLAYLGERIPPIRPVPVIGFLILAALGAVMSYQTVAEATEEGTTRAWAAAGACAGVLIGALGFAPLVRRAAAGALPLDPSSFVHATALASVVALVVISFVPLLALGRPPALNDAATEQMGRQMEQLPPGLILRLTCYIYFWAIAALPCFVGFPITRGYRTALNRCGLVAPSWWQVGGAVAAACALTVVMTVVDYMIGRVWSAMGWPTTDAKKFEELMAYAISPIGAVVIGVSAGLSEELFFRGILQPRLGLLLSNVCFAAVHAFQYSWDALLSVFLIGLLLGLIRKKTNTSTAAIVHGTYDFLLVLATYYGIDPTKWFGG